MLSPSLQTQSTNSSFFAKYSFRSHLKLKMAFAVTHLGMKENCIASIYTWCLIYFSKNLWAILRLWSVNFNTIVSSWKSISFSFATVFNSLKLLFCCNNSDCNLNNQLNDHVSSCFSCCLLPSLAVHLMVLQPSHSSFLWFTPWSFPFLLSKVHR